MIIPDLDTEHTLATISPFSKRKAVLDKERSDSCDYFVSNSAFPPDSKGQFKVVTFFLVSQHHKRHGIIILQVEIEVPPASCIVLKKKEVFANGWGQASTNDQRFSSKALTLLGKLKNKDDSSKHKHPRMRGSKCVFLSSAKDDKMCI